MADEHASSGQPGTPGRWWTGFLRSGIVLAAVYRLVLGKSAPRAAAPETAIRPERDDGHPVRGPLHPTVHFERTDASFPWILAILLGAIVLAFVVHYSIWGFFKSYRAYQASIKHSNYAVAPAERTGLPPEPRLEQINRLSNIERGNVYLREEQKDTILHEYGTAGQGFVRVPIERAMDFLANKLPIRSKGPSAEQTRRQNGLVDAGESNSGRMFRGSHHE